MHQLVREWLYVRVVLHVPEHQRVLVPERNIGHPLLPDHLDRPEMKDRTRTLCLIETTTEVKVISIVVRKRMPVHQVPGVDRQVVARQLPVLIVRADIQTAVRQEVQADEVKVGPLAKITVPKETTALPAGETVAVQTVVAATPVLLEAAVPVGAMFLADRQKDVLLEVREVIALPVHPKEATVQEDNLFLYY